jgi:hypothetical protein
VDGDAWNPGGLERRLQRALAERAGLEMRIHLSRIARAWPILAVTAPLGPVQRNRAAAVFTPAAARP